MNDQIVARYERQGEVLINEAKSIMIVDETTRELASEFTVRAREAIRAIDLELRPEIDQAHQLHKSLLSRAKRLKAPFEEAKSIVDAEIGRDYKEQQYIKHQKEREEARRQAEERRKQEAALAAEASERIKEGDLEAAQEIADTEIIVTPVQPVAPVQGTVRTAAGSTTVRMDIKVELDDKDRVIRAVAQGLLPNTLVDVNLGAVKRYAKANNVKKIPGLVITETPIVSGRG